jgi:hypothetical protein
MNPLFPVVRNAPVCGYRFLYHSGLEGDDDWEGIVSGLKESLSKILSVEGVRTVALIDIATGMVVRAVGVQHAWFSTLAAGAADEARLARVSLGPGSLGSGRADDDLEEISVTTSGSLHLSKILDTRLGEGLLLFVDLDRARSNIALASLLVGQVAPAVLA